MELEGGRQEIAIESTDSEARYDTEVKFTNDEFKLTSPELSGGNNDKGDAAAPPAKKTKKVAAGKA